jgi:hypothetical protein
MEDIETTVGEDDPLPFRFKVVDLLFHAGVVFDLDAI